MSPSDRHVIAIVVEAADPATAKANAVQLMTDNWPALFATYIYAPFDHIVPSRLDSQAANIILDNFWQTMRAGYVECIKTILGAVALAEGDSDTLLDNQDFRRACAQMGSLDGRHILIWGPVLDPIISYAEIQSLQQGTGGLFEPGNLWVVAMEIKEDKEVANGKATPGG